LFFFFQIHTSPFLLYFINSLKEGSGLLCFPIAYSRWLTVVYTSNEQTINKPRRYFMKRKISSVTHIHFIHSSEHSRKNRSMHQKYYSIEESNAISYDKVWCPLSAKFHICNTDGMWLPLRYVMVYQSVSYYSFHTVDNMQIILHYNIVISQGQ
jgi:hypothetical protein